MARCLRRAKGLQLARGDVHRAKRVIEDEHAHTRSEALTKDVADGARHSTRRTVIEL
jgi:hypothetical protein